MAKKGSSTWRPPGRVNVLEQLWKVVVSRDKLVSRDGTELEGECDTAAKEIRLSGILAGLGEVFCHEVLHVLWYATGFSQVIVSMLQRYGMPPPSAKAVTEEIEELHSSIIGPALWATLKRNRLRFDK